MDADDLAGILRTVTVEDQVVVRRLMRQANADVPHPLIRRPRLIGERGRGGSDSGNRPLVPHLIGAGKSLVADREVFLASRLIELFDEVDVAREVVVNAGDWG